MSEILLDMDGVIADTMGSVISIIEEEHGINLCHNDIQDYWFKGMVVEPGLIVDVLRRDGLYRNLDVITGAVRGVNRLRERYDVRVCTAPMKGAEFCEDEKREWLAEHFDQELAEQAIVTSDKAQVVGKILIEDNPDVAGGIWKPVIFDQAWNRNIDEHPRMYGWHDLGVIDRVMAEL